MPTTTSRIAMAQSSSSFFYSWPCSMPTGSYKVSSVSMESSRPAPEAGNVLSASVWRNRCYEEMAKALKLEEEVANCRRKAKAHKKHIRSLQRKLEITEHLLRSSRMTSTPEHFVRLYPNDIPLGLDE